MRQTMLLAQNVKTSILCLTIIFIHFGYGWGQTPGKSLSFDGVNDYVKFSGNNDFGLASNFQGAFTFEAWVKDEGTQFTGRVFDFGGSFNNYITFLVYGGNLGSVFAFRGSDGTFYQFYVPPFPTTWTHLTCTLDETGTAKVFYNGVEVGSQSNWPTINDIYDRNNSTLGKSQWPGEPYFKGKMKEVRVWNDIRTPAEIAEWMHCEISGQEDNLVAYLKLNQGIANANNNSTDAFANNFGRLSNLAFQLNNFALSGTSSNWVDDAPTSFDSDPYHKNAIEFYGTPDYIDLNNEANFDFQDEYTIQFWLKNTVNSNLGQLVLTKGDSNGTLSYYMDIYGETMYFGQRSPGESYFAIAANGLLIDEWTHITLSAKEENGGVRFKTYFNGQQKATGFKPNSFIPQTDHKVRLGAGEFYGTLSNIKFWDRALDDSEVALEYGTIHPEGTPNLVSQYVDYENSIFVGLVDSIGGNDGIRSGVPAFHADPCFVQFTAEPQDIQLPNFSMPFMLSAEVDLCNDTYQSYQWQLDGQDIPGATSLTYTNNSPTANDLGRYSCVVTACGQSFTTREAIITIANQGKVLHFDGVDDYVSFSDDLGTSLYTVEMWLRFDSQPKNQNIIVRTNAQKDIIYSQLAVSEDGHFQHNTYDTNRFEMQSVKHPEQIIANKWYHVAIRHFGAGDGVNNWITLEVNGVPSAQEVAGTITGASNWLIGDDILNFGHFFGEMDELRIWNISTNTQAQQTLPSASSNLIHYFRFDEGIADSNNATPSMVNTMADPFKSNVATLNNFALQGTNSNWLGCDPFESTPTINGLNNQYITLGNPLEITPWLGTVDGDETFQWYKDGDPIPGATTLPFSIPSIDLSDEGDYQLEVMRTNDCNYFSDPFAVLVKGTGEVLNFSGANEYIQIPAEVVNQYTIEAWIKFDDEVAMQSIIVATNEEQALNTFTNQLYTDADGYLVHRTLSGVTNDVVIRKSLLPLNSNQWYHVAARASSTSGVDLLLDGVVQGATESINGLWSGMTMWKIGGTSRAGTESDTLVVKNFKGEIDELRIWNWYRPTAQILQEIDHEIQNLGLPGLLHYFKFNTGRANGYNGAIARNYIHDFKNLFSTPIKRPVQFFGFSMNGEESNFSDCSPITNPELDYSLDGITPSIGQPLTIDLNISTGDTAQLNYIWRLDGAVIEGAIDPLYYIESMTEADFGQYDVIVSDNCSPMYIDTLDVLFSPVNDLCYSRNPNATNYPDSTTYVFCNNNELSGSACSVAKVDYSLSGGYCDGPNLHNGTAVVFHLPLTEPQVVDLTLSNIETNVDLFIMSDDCNIDNCLGTSTNDFTEDEFIRVALDAGDYYIIAHEREFFDFDGSDSLVLEIQMYDNKCSFAQPVTCGEMVSGDTQNGSNFMDDYCDQGGYTSVEQVYEIEVSDPVTLSAALSNMSADLDLFLLDSMCNEVNCLASSTQGPGIDEAILYGVQPGMYYFVIDGKNGATGTFDFTVDCAPYFTASVDETDAWIDLEWSIDKKVCVPQDTGVIIRLITTPNTILYEEEYSTAALTPDVITGSFRHLVGEDHDRMYVLRVYNRLNNQTLCNEIKSGSTLPFQAPEIISVSQATAPDSIEIVWRNHSQLSDEFRLYRDGNQIASLSEGYTEDSLIVTYVDRHNMNDSNSIDQNEMYNYCIETYNITLEQAYGQVCANGATYDIAFNATDGVPVDAVSLIWNDVSAFCDGILIRRNGIQLEMLSPLETFYHDLSPIRGTVAEYEMALLRDGQEFIRVQDDGFSEANGLISGRVITEDGAYPVQNAEVALTKDTLVQGAISQVEVATTVTDFAGRFTFSEVVYGLAADYNVAVSKVGSDFLPESITFELNAAFPEKTDLLFSDQSDVIVISDNTLLDTFQLQNKAAEDLVILNWEYTYDNSQTTYFTLKRNGALIFEGNDATAKVDSFVDLSGVPGFAYTYALEAFRYEEDEINREVLTTSTTYPMLTPISGWDYDLGGQLQVSTNEQVNPTITFDWSAYSHASQNFDGYRIFRNNILIGEVAKNSNPSFDYIGIPNVEAGYKIRTFKKLNGATYESSPYPAMDSMLILNNLWKPAVLPTVDRSIVVDLDTMNTSAAFYQNAVYTGVLVERKPSGSGDDMYVQIGTLTKDFIAAQVEGGSLPLVWDAFGVPNQPYTYRISTYINLNGQRYKRDTVFDKVCPAIVGPLALTKTEEVGKVTLNWTDRSLTQGANNELYINYQGYEITRRDTLMGSLTKVIATLPAQSHTYNDFLTNPIFDLFFNQYVTMNYEYGLRAYFDIDTTRYYSDPLFIKAKPLDGATNEPLPTNFVASKDIPGHIKLCWEWNATKPSEFVIYRDTVALDTMPSTARAYYDYEAPAEPSVLYKITSLFNGNESEAVLAEGRMPANMRFRGRIANIYSGVGLEGVNVYYKNLENTGSGITQGTFSGVTTSDATGNYYFEDIPKTAGLDYEISVFSNNADFNTDENSYESFASTTISILDDNEYVVDFSEYSEQEENDGVSPIQFVTATPDADSMHVVIRWSPVHGNYDGFQIYRANQLIGELRKGDGFTFTDVNGFAGIQYTYSVRSYKNELQGRVFSTKVATQTVFPAVLPVENLTATPFAKSNKMLVSWSHPLDNHDTYRIRRNGVFMASIPAGEVLMWYDTTGIPGLMYQYEVAAIKGAFISELRTVTKAFKGVGEVDNLQTSINNLVQACSYALTNDNHVTLSWEYTPDAADGFEIYRDGELIAEIEGTVLSYGNLPLVSGDTMVINGNASYDDYEGDPGTTHTYHVLAYVVREGDRYTSGIEELFLTTSAVFPEVSQVIGLDVAPKAAFGSVQLEFGFPPNIVQGFQIIRDGLPIDTVFEINQGDYTYQDFTGIPGEEYTYTVRAYDLRKGQVYFGGTVCEETVTYPIVPTPQNFTASQGTFENHIELSWLLAFEAVIDSFYLENLTLGTTTSIAPGKRGYVDVVNTFTEEQYEYRVRAARINEGQEVFSDWSTMATGWCTRQINGSEDENLEDDLLSTLNGHSLDIDGDWAVSGAPDGEESISIYRRVEGGWNLFQSIRSPYPMTNSNYGFSVAISGHTMVVGLPLSGNGRVAVYEFDGERWGNLQLISSPGPGNFGWSVDIDGDHMIIGNPWWNFGGGGTTHGAVYWLERAEGSLWQFKSSMTGNGQLGNGDVLRFGYGVAIEDGYSAVSWNRPSANFSEVITYTQNANGDWGFNGYLSNYAYTYSAGTEFDNLDIEDGVMVIGDLHYQSIGRVTVLELENNQPSAAYFINGNTGVNSLFGATTAVAKIPSPIDDRIYVAVGSRSAVVDGIDQVGSAQLFSNVSGTFQEVDQIYNDNPSSFDRNGYCVAISKDAWASGIPRANGLDNGAVVIKNLLKAPSKVNATEGTSLDFDPTETTISWEFDGNADLLAGFNIYRDDVFLTYRDKATATQIGPNTIADNWNDNSGVPGKPYVYTVKSVNNLTPFESYGTSDEGYNSADGIIRGAVKTQLGFVPIPDATITATGIVDGEVYTYSTTTLSNGQYTFNNIYYSDDPHTVTEYKVRAEYLDHTIIPQTTDIAVMNPLNVPTQDVIDFFDITAYVVNGVVAQPDVNCPIEGIKVTAIQNGIPLIGQEAFTDAEGRYSLVINPNEEGLNELKVRIDQSLEVDQVVTTYNFVPDADTVFTNFENFPIVTELNFVDALSYDVQLKVKNTCNDPISNAKWNIRIRTLDGCFDEVYQTNSNGNVTVPLIPLNYKMNVVGADIQTAQNQQALDYFANFPVTLNLLDMHRDSIDALTKIEIEALSARQFTFHKAATIEVSGLDDLICNTQTAILEQGSPYGLDINITEAHNGFTCPVEEGFVQITNPASLDDGPVILPYVDALGGFPTYTFTAGGPNAIFPHAYAITFDYMSDDGAFLGRLTRAAFVEGSIAIPGTDIIVDPSSGNDAIPYPLMVLRDPPGDQSSSYIAAEQTISFSTEMTIENEFDGSIYSELSTEIFSVGLEVNASINGGYNNERGITMENSVTTATQISTSDDEDNIGRDADIIVGTGIVMQYGLIKEFRVGECDEILIIKKYGISPNAATTTWSYQISQIEDIIQGYVNDSLSVEAGTLTIERNGEELSTTDARTFLASNIKNWKEVLVYHDVKTVPYYVLCTLTPNPGLSQATKDAIQIWQAQLRPFFGTFVNGEFVLNDEIVWDQQLINAYNAASAAIRNLQQGADLSIWSFPYVGGDNSIDLNVPLLDFDLVDLASVLNSSTLTDYTNNFGDQVKNITTGGNITIEESINNAQASETSMSNSVYMGAELDIAGSVGGDVTLQTGGFAGLGAGIIFGKVTEVTSTEFKLGTSFETSMTRTNAYASTIEESVEVGYTIFDDDNADAFSFAVVQGVAPNMTPYFDYFGGHSSCPPEDGSVFVDAPKIAILDLESGGTSQTKELFNVPADEAATFYVIVENQSPIASQPDRELEVYLESGSNDNGAIVTINGVSLNNSTYIDSFSVGEPDTLILTIERGPTFYDYPDIQIGFEPVCGEGPREYIYASAYFVNPCSPVTLVAPNENWVLNDDTTKLVVAMQDYDPNNPFLVDATLQYRRLGAGMDWTDVPGLQLERGNFISGDSLAANDDTFAEGQIPKYFFVWTIPTTEGSYPDGDYELRVRMVCDNFSSTISNVIAGKIARKGLNLFGNPQPADQLWTTGDEISFTFNKDLDCALLTQDFINDNVQVFNESTGQREPFTLSCYANKLIFVMDNPMSDYDGQFLTIQVDNIPSLEGNISLPHSWTFRVITQKIYWADADTIKLRMYQDDVQTLNIQLENSTFTETISGLTFTAEDGGFEDWLTITDPMTQPFAVNPSGRTISFAVDASEPVGVYTETVNVLGVEAFGNTPQVHIQLEVLVKPPNWEVNPGDFATSMNMIANWKFEDDPVGTVSMDEADLISVWVGNEIRAVAPITESGEFFASYLTIYGQPEDGTDTPLEFRIWDADEGIEYDGFPADTVFYLANSSRGTTANPEMLDVDRDYDQAKYIYLRDGWTGFSLTDSTANMQVMHKLRTLSSLTDGDLIVTGDKFSQYSDSLGWFNFGISNLSMLDNNEGYMIYLENGPDTLRVTGTTPAPNDILLKSGWNWLGFPFENPESLNDVLSLNSANATGDDRIKIDFPLPGETAKFANYDIGNDNWNDGNIDDLEPNNLYKFFSGHPNGAILSWDPDNNMKGELPDAGQERSGIVVDPNDPTTWVMPELASDEVMPIIGEVIVNGVIVSDPADKVAFFENDTIRGLASIENIEELAIYALSMLAEKSSVPYDIRYFDASEGVVLQATNNLSFAINGVGSIFDPYEIVFDENPCPGKLTIGPDGNPFATDKTFEASQEIQVIGSLIVPANVNIILSAPKVTISNQLNPQSGATITIRPDGCE